MAYAIRPYRDGDAPALVELVRRSIADIGREAYSAEQTQAWAARQLGEDDYRTKAALGSAIFIAEDANGDPAAYVLMERDGHVDRLYTHPDHRGEGLAAQLLAAVEHYARPHGIGRLYTEASDLARPAFEHAGYKMIARRNFEIDGVPIHNWAMEKRL